MEKIPVRKNPVFLAFKIPDELKLKIRSVQDQIEILAPQTLTMVKPGEMHITLAFMGKISDASRQRVIGLAQTVANRTSSFEITPRAISALPRPTRPSVIYLGLSDPQDQLVRLIRTLETELSSAYLTPIRGAGSIIPHVTLGRVKRKVRTFHLEPLRDFLSENRLDLSDIKFTPEAITVFTIDQQRTGSRYNQFATLPLVKLK